MSTKELISSNKDPNTKKIFKLAEETIRKITQLHLNNPKIKVELDYWDWDGGVLGEQDSGDPDGYLYCRVDDKTISNKERDDIINKKGEAWTDRLAEVFQDENNKKSKFFRLINEFPFLIMFIILYFVVIKPEFDF